MSRRARAIGLEHAEVEAQTEALNASLARNAERERKAREVAHATYGTDDVEVLNEVEYVDGGYWVAARVWVYADDEDES